MCGLPLRCGAKTFEGCTSLLFPGAPRIAVDRDWRGGGHLGRWKPGHPLLSHPHGPLGHPGPQRQDDETALSHSESVQQVQGRAGPIGPEVCESEHIWERGVSRVSPEGSPESVTGRVEG